MSFLNFKTQEINCKIVYFGPSLGGKTINLQYLYDWACSHSDFYKPSEKIACYIIKNTDFVRCLSFTPFPQIEMKGFKIRLHLYTLSGATFYQFSKEQVLKGVDGIVFVADSQRGRLDSNLQYFSNLKKIIINQGGSLLKIPYVLQLNKRDLPEDEIHSVHTLTQALQFKGEPVFETVATQGIGVLEIFQEIARQVYEALKKTNLATIPTIE